MRRVIDWISGHRWETATGLLAAALVTSVGFLVAAAGDSGEPEATPETTTTTVALEEDSTPTTVGGEETAVTTTAPTVDGPSGIVAVVVDNVPGVGLQIGIDSADLLIETPVEGGITRFTALYGRELPSLVGPVRSLRPVSADMLAPFNPIVFATGGQRFVTGAVEAAGATIISAAADTFAFQSLERPQPYHLFVSPGVEVSPGPGLEVPWVTSAWPGGSPGTEITLPISGGVTWRFEDGVYVRYTDGAPHEVQPGLDESPVPLARETLVVLVAHQKSAGYTDGAGADVPTFDVIGGGDVYVLHGGEVIRGTWSRASQAADYVFTDVSGALIPIPSSTLYLGIVPEGLEVDVLG